MEDVRVAKAFLAKSVTYARQRDAERQTDSADASVTQQEAGARSASVSSSILQTVRLQVRSFCNIPLSSLPLSPASSMK